MEILQNMKQQCIMYQNAQTMPMMTTPQAAMQQGEMSKKTLICLTPLTSTDQDRCYDTTRMNRNCLAHLEERSAHRRPSKLDPDLDPNPLTISKQILQEKCFKILLSTSPPSLSSFK